MAKKKIVNRNTGELISTNELISTLVELQNKLKELINYKEALEKELEARKK